MWLRVGRKRTLRQVKYPGSSLCAGLLVFGVNNRLESSPNEGGAQLPPFFATTFLPSLLRAKKYSRINLILIQIIRLPEFQKESCAHLCQVRLSQTGVRRASVGLIYSGFGQCCSINNRDRITNCHFRCSR